MNDWFSTLSGSTQLPAETANHLRDDGFCIVAGPSSGHSLPAISTAYDRAMAESDAGDRREGRTTIRVDDFVNRGAEFDSLYTYAPLLAACCNVIRQPFKLSAMIGRTLLAGKPAQELHVDYAGDSLGWTMVGFIFMIDGFTSGNGATCFVPGSHRTGRDASLQPVPACGPAGSMIIYNGSVWHGHGANVMQRSRRSVQGSFIRREAAPPWISRLACGVKPSNG